MTVISISGVHRKTTLPQVVNILFRIIQGQFEAWHLKQTNNKKKWYIRLSDELNPVEVLEQIKKGTKYGAFVVPPNQVPKLPKVKKAGRIPAETLNTRHHTPADDRPGQVLLATHEELFVEMQSKFTGLYKLSSETNHKLLDNIAQTLFERLKAIMDTDAASLCEGFKLSEAYRQLHPHTGDFQLILGSLHALQDAAGEPRAELQESELAAYTDQHYDYDNLACDKISEACRKYSQRIVSKLTEHIKGLKSDGDQTDGVEESARHRVRQQLKNISPHLPSIIRPLIVNQFHSSKLPFPRLRVYGEPFLPTNHQLSRVMSPFVVRKLRRSWRLHNGLRVNVMLPHYDAVMALDGTVLDDAKLVVRTCEEPLHELSADMRGAMRSACARAPWGQLPPPSHSKTA